MAKFVYLSPKITLNGTANDISSSVRQAVLDLDVAEVDVTSFGSAGWTELLGGIKSGSVSIDFYDDVAAAGIDKTIWDLWGSTAAITIRPGGTAAIGTANPDYQGTVLVKQTTVGGAVGDAAVKSVTWPTTGAVTRATA